MKYWVYKESRVLGPFDKEAISGFPGLDAGTLVCAGDPAGGGSWIPAGELEGLKGIAASPSLDDRPSSIGLLDRFQIDSAGLIGDGDFPESIAEELFQDAAFKKGFGNALTARASADEAEVRRAREKISEMTAHLEAVYRRISGLEAGQAELIRRLASKDLELFSRGDATPRSMPPPPPPAPPPPLVVAVAVAAVPEEAPPPIDETEAPIEWQQAPGEWSELPGERPEVPIASVETPTVVTRSFPSFPGEGTAAAKLMAPELAPPPPIPELLDLSALASAAAATAPLSVELPPTPAVAPAPEIEPKTFSFGKPKSFKIVPTVKSFKMLGAEEVVPAVSPNPIPEFKVEPILETPAPATLPDVAVPAPAPMRIMMPAPTPELGTVSNFFPFPEIQKPMGQLPEAPPPNTPSRSQSFPDLTFGDAAAPSEAAAQASPPVTMAWSGGADAPANTAAPADAAVAARFAKPESAPPTREIRKPGRSSKAFLIGGGVLVTMLVILGVIFMRQPKDDLKQMTTLDDGKAPIGLPADDGAAAPPPSTVATPTAAPGPSAEHAAAIALVKDFPLDGGRGTIGRWLQYSYAASPDAGTEAWNASSTGEKTVLVEYRLVPVASGGKRVLYLFEVDPNGIVMGKNVEAREMLAGGSAGAISLVKDFPLDGGRGTVGHWLQGARVESPGAGNDDWSATSAGGGAMLVEYRPASGAAGGKGALYQFEVDSNGIVMGRNPEARQMLAGGPPPGARKAKKKAAKRAAPKRRPAATKTQGGPPPPLPDSGELRPPAENDGAFGPDTVNSGI